MTALGFVLNIHCCSLAKVGWDESHLQLVTGCCPAGPALGAALLHTVITYRLTFMAQHALVDFLGQDQVVRLRSRPDFVTVQLSLCALEWAWRGEPNRNVHSSVIGRTKSKCIVLSACENCPESIPVQFCEIQTLYSKSGNVTYLQDIAKHRPSVTNLQQTTDLSSLVNIMHCWLALHNI